MLSSGAGLDMGEGGGEGRSRRRRPPRTSLLYVYHATFMSSRRVEAIWGSARPSAIDR